MPNPVCDHDSLIAAGACYSQLRLNDEQYRIVKIVLMALQLKTIGGTDYTGNIANLISNSRCKATLTPSEKKNIAIAIEANNATRSGATVGSVSALLATGACLQGAELSQLEAAELQLRCELGYGHSYPQ